MTLFQCIFITDHIMWRMIKFFNLFLCNSYTIINNYYTVTFLNHNTNKNMASPFVMINTVLDKITYCPFHQVFVNTGRANSERFIRFPFNRMSVINIHIDEINHYLTDNSNQILFCETYWLHIIFQF